MLGTDAAGGGGTSYSVTSQAWKEPTVSTSDDVLYFDQTVYDENKNAIEEEAAKLKYENTDVASAGTDAQGTDTVKILIDTENSIKELTDTYYNYLSNNLTVLLELIEYNIEYANEHSK